VQGTRALYNKGRGVERAEVRERSAFARPLDS
jgi:hypothetical protein